MFPEGTPFEGYEPGRALTQVS
jgi:hypothetical protein